MLFTPLNTLSRNELMHYNKDNSQAGDEELKSGDRVKCGCVNNNRTSKDEGSCV